jgi:carboxyl-terminal processing protease
MGSAVAGLALGTLLISVLLPLETTAQEKKQLILEDNPKAIVDEVWQIVNNEFVDKEFNHADWLKKREELLNQDYKNPKQAYKAIREALEVLNDPYTRFLEPDEFQVLTNQTSGEMSGVGIRLMLDKRTSQFVIVDTLKNSPAMEAGIKQGDRLVRIDGKPTALMTIEQASEAISGEIGTEVKLQLLRPNKEVYNVTLTRSQIEIASVSYTVKEEGNLKIGYIKLDEFSSHAAEQMEEAIKDLHKQKVAGYVLDLRNNPGGLLFASVDIARQWMPQGEIVSTIDRKGGDRHFKANNTALTDLPLVILVNKGSASASEILTGALKENGRATIVGTTTYGKGTVQSVHSLEDGSGLAVTIARYYPPSGTDINHKGINPDIVSELTMEQQMRFRQDPNLVGTAADPQYKQAITVLKTRVSPLGTMPIPPKPVGIRLGE